MREYGSSVSVITHAEEAEVKSISFGAKLGLQLKTIYFRSTFRLLRMWDREYLIFGDIDMIQKRFFNSFVIGIFMIRRYAPCITPVQMNGVPINASPRSALGERLISSFGRTTSVYTAGPV